MDQRKKATMVVQLFLVFFYGLIFSVNYAFAVSGVCSNCHVMHAQESNIAGATTFYGVGSPTSGQGGYDQLLQEDTCLGCHGSGGSVGAPIVQHSADPVAATTQLAGGDFFWAGANGGDRFIHNTAEIGDADDIWANTTPPGWDAVNYKANDGGIGTTWDATHQLTCAGVNGCHGTHSTAAAADNMAAMSGSHHSNTSTAAWRLGGSIGDSYRLLLGIKGYEVGDYEENNSSNADGDHNIYYGKDRSGIATGGNDASSSGAVDSATISYFCGQCHGGFHGEQGTNTGLSSNSDILTNGVGNVSDNTWIRHPVDFAMPLAGEYNTYGNYVLSAPVGSTNTGNTTMTGIAEDRIVTCLSCHLAHGSKYKHILRFDDTAMVLGTSGAAAATGCFACHTGKDGV